MRTKLYFFVPFNSRDEKNSAKSGPFDVFLSVLGVERKIRIKISPKSGLFHYFHSN